MVPISALLLGSSPKVSHLIMYLLRVSSFLCSLPRSAKSKTQKQEGVLEVKSRYVTRQAPTSMR